MARKEVHVDMMVHLVMRVDRETDPEDVLQDLDYSFESQTYGAEIMDSEIRDWHVLGNDREEEIPHLAAMDDLSQE